ncbi:MAG TPA: putative metal-binding motif-containing protein [Polyangiaceae bacterium LLY-WYZ-15_(1-7)]|nr:hypothetical protein [Myxococcales bacterium]MAT29212.1 hypothetical protein [Sandaracinus sp.]HJK93246.1 putative metal-binding motif-containing protein [Polyangiaceae bacterium LLY-WYZ-15_(1-7)]MBJ71034.1 hypothetical protein [Sandaracinus sp.]HJL04094.1 putative metal-binding motif-containing protein [Polyangiaceae bacterium LLY-WYZ-15_(1-7)]
MDTRTMIAPALALLLGGCSLMGLDEVEAEPCSALDPAAADRLAAHQACDEALSARAPLSDPCEAWVCNLELEGALYCTVDAPDRDGDGVGDAACVPAGATGDCDDGDATVAPNRDEACDGRDNDCDGVVDEGLLTPGMPARVPDADGSAEQVALAAGAEGFVGVLRREEGGAQALYAWFQGSSPGRVGTLTLRNPLTAADDPGLGVAALSSGDLFAAFAPTTMGCGETVAVGEVDPSGAIASAVLATGLPDLDGELCADRSEDQRLPAVAALDTRRLVAWRTDGGALRLATTDAEGTVMGAVVDGGMLQREPARPALLALPALGAVLLAAPREDGVGLRLVELEASGPALGDEVRVEGAPIRVALGAGAGAGDGVEVGLAIQEGEGRGASLALQRLTVSASAITPGERTAAGASEGAARPAVAWGERPTGWVLSWVERAGVLRAQLFGRERGSAGGAVDLLGVGETAGAELAFGPAVRARSEGGFEVAAHAGGLGEDGTGLYRVPLGCAE